MNESALDDELRKPEYATLTDAEAADVIMSKTQLIRRPVDAYAIQKAASLTGLWGTLKIAATNHDLNDPPRGTAVAFIDWIATGQPLDLDSQQVRAMADLLIHHGLATQGQIDNLDALANTTARWVDVHNIGEVGIGLVINSRKRIAQGA